ncbi:MAG: M13 family metallopeptidase, partial [archaeon]|nr:M13 family metallopeptidase [archaeon]
ISLVFLGLVLITILLIFALYPRAFVVPDTHHLDPTTQAQWGGSLGDQGLAELAASVKSAMSRQTSADPCQDFYQYACGGWLEEHPERSIPNDKSSWSRSFSEIAKKNAALIDEILTDDWPLIQPLFKSCLDQQTRDALGWAPIGPLLQEIDAIWELDALFPVLAMLHRFEVPAFFSFWVDADMKDPAHNIAYFDEGGLLLGDRDYYQSRDPALAELRDQYTNHTLRSFLLIGLDAEAALAETAASFRVEKALAAHSRTPPEHPDYHKGPFRSFFVPSGPDQTEPVQEETTELWSSYLTAFLGEDSAGRLTAESQVAAMNPEFLSNMTALLLSTPLHEIKSYLRWMVVAEFSDVLSHNFVMEDFSWLQAQYGLLAPPSALSTCTAAVNGVLGQLVGRYFVNQAFTETSKELARDLVGRIVLVFNQTISAADWITSSATKEHAHQKMNKMTKLIGYPDHWHDYEELHITPGGFVQSIFNAKVMDAEETVRKIGQPVDRLEWMMTPQTVNAYYAPEYNEIVFPAAILQEPFFNASWPASMNFGAIGMVMGHEVGHATDDEGSQFDADGALDNWWDPESWSRFLNRTACVRELYNGFRVPGFDPPLYLNGELTLGENIADIGGLRFSFQAYRNISQHSDQHDDRIKTFFGMTNEQLFFVSYAQVWCTAYRPQYLRWLVLNNPHSPAQFRVNGAVSQNEFFAQAFQCPSDSPMGNRKCSIW